MEDKLNEKYK